MGNGVWQRQVMLVVAIALIVGVGSAKAQPSVRIEPSTKSGAEQDAGDRLDTLKKQFPNVMMKWLKTINASAEADRIQMPVCRMTSENEAKVVVAYEKTLLVFYLRFYDRTWTTSRFEGRFQGVLAGFKDEYLSLVVAVDEAAAK